MNGTKITAWLLFFAVLLTTINATPLHPLAQSSTIYLELENPFALSGDKKTPMDPENPLAAPFLNENQVVFVPLGFASQSLGCTVDWNKGANGITLTKDGTTATMEIGSTLFTIGNKKLFLSAAPVLYDNCVYVPLRPLVEDFLQKKISWDNSGYIAIGETAHLFETDPALLPNIARKLGALQPIGTQENFEKMLKENNLSYGRGAMDIAMGAPMAAAKAENSSSMETGANYATTNIQVAGVDEADIVKTDGTYIYFLHNNQLTVVNAKNPTKMILSDTLTFSEEGNTDFYPVDLYLDNGTITIIGNQHNFRSNKINATDEMLTPELYPTSSAQTAVYVYDTTHLPTLTRTRTFTIDGYYHSSRKIGDMVYLLTNNYLNRMNAKTYPLPSYTDDQAAPVTIGFDKIDAFPNFFTTSVLTIASIPTNDIKKPAQTKSYLTNAENTYVSNNALYFTLSNYQYANRRKADSMTVSTNIFKFELQNGAIQYSAMGKVPGTVLNQFSMDEYNNDFRIATTDMNNGETNNNLFILDGQLKLEGQLRDLAKGERIYSTRFLGDQIYMVTFKQVDPLFVIDAKNPNQPKVLGQLKIPGYSTYLHPLDATHLIGFGKDTRTEMRGDREVVLDNGLKMSLFDITDFNQPKELFTEIIGESGSYSELLSNHKALLFDPVRGLFGFPADAYISTKQMVNGQPYYGTLRFNGAFVYSVDIQKGFQLKAQISHPDDSGDFSQSVQRVIYIGDTIYTLSEKQMTATSLTSGKEMGTIYFE